MSCFLRALRREPVERTPVWLMRQAGRYLPEYRALRKHHSFLEMCQNPDIACEVTLQPLERFSLDAAIVFADILLLPHAMGLELAFEAGGGPVFGRVVRDERTVAQLPVPDPEQSLGYVMATIRQVSKSCSVPVIGFCGSPWTVATYMVEGGRTEDFSCIKAMCREAPKVLLALLQKLALASGLYLHAQIEAGAQAVMIFDTWGSVLEGQAYHTFSLSFIKEILSYLRAQPALKEIPIIVFAKEGGAHLEAIAAIGCNAIGIGNSLSLSEARLRVGDRVALQGNLDPALLYASNTRLIEGVRKVLADFGKGSGHVFNLGHGISKDVSPEKVATVIETVRSFSPFYHSG